MLGGELMLHITIVIDIPLLPLTTIWWGFSHGASHPSGTRSGAPKVSDTSATFVYSGGGGLWVSLPQQWLEQP